jgi:hypothetical protein
MQFSVHSETLVRLISKFGNTAQEARQVSKRIIALLPVRLSELKREHCRSHNAMRAERMALADTRYEVFINETSDISFQATQARIQYETHAMLFKARQSLNAFHRDTR